MVRLLGITVGCASEETGKRKRDSHDSVNDNKIGLARERERDRQTDRQTQRERK
jgi:hypothetical protein